MENVAQTTEKAPETQALLSVVKESLIDWSVRDGFKVVAWIGREKLGYRVRFVEFGKEHPGYWFRYFREAKGFATRA